MWEGGLCATTGDKAWVGGRGSITAVDEAGDHTTRKKVGRGWCEGIARADDALFVTWCGGRKIYKLSSDGTVTQFSSLTFSPWGLKHLHAGCLLVCGGDGLYTVTEQKEERIPLDVNFKLAIDVEVNNNGDIAVADYHEGHVFIFDSKYKLVASYGGEEQSPSPFRPRAVTTDGMNFVVSDPDNHNIHVVDKDGACLTVYQTTRDCQESPFRIDMAPSKCLWVKFDGGTICVYDIV